MQDKPPGISLGKKSKKIKNDEKTTEQEIPRQDDTLKTFPLTTDAVASTDSSVNSNSEAESGLIEKRTYEDHQDEQYRQHQFRMHHQQHLDQVRLQHQQQQHFQQHQHIERLMHQQRQEDMYRQHIQQEEIYRHHLRQQEILQARTQQLQQQQLHAHHQSQQYHESVNQVGQHWNPVDRKCGTRVECFFFACVHR